MRRVLMIVPFFPPMAGGGVHRPLAFARHLPRYGWRPVVLTQSADAYWIRDAELAGRVRDVDVVRTPTLSGQALAAAWRRRRRAAPRSVAGEDPGAARIVLQHLLSLVATGGVPAAAEARR